MKAVNIARSLGPSITITLLLAIMGLDYPTRQMSKLLPMLEVILSPFGANTANPTPRHDTGRHS